MSDGCYVGLAEAFSEKLDGAVMELRIRRLIKKLYDAKDKLDQAFAEIDAVNREIRIIQHQRSIRDTTKVMENDKNKL